MITPAEGSGLLKTENVRGTFHNTEHTGIAAVIGTNATRLTLGESSTAFTPHDPLTRRHEGFGEDSNPLRLHLDDVKRHPLGRTRSYPWQGFQREDQRLNRKGQLGHRIKPGSKHPGQAKPLSH
jgi:hypothetical protein